jgi:hypothetical protein
MYFLNLIQTIILKINPIKTSRLVVAYPDFQPVLVGCWRKRLWIAAVMTVSSRLNRDSQFPTHSQTNI